MDTKMRKEDKRNPQESSNFLSWLFFWWTVPIFRKGAKRDLKMEDLYDPSKYYESQSLGDRLEREWKNELRKAAEGSSIEKKGGEKSIRKPNLLWAIARVIWVPFMLQGGILLVQAAGLKVMQPVLQGLVISYFNPGQSLISRDQVLLDAGLLVLSVLGAVFTAHHNIFRFNQIGMSVRVACCSLIYRKVLRLDQAAANKTATGRVANLISNDVSRFDLVFNLLHHVWIMPTQVLLIASVMWRSIGVITLVAIGAIILQSISMEGIIRKNCAKLRFKTAVKTDERVQLMSELISGIQVVKMYSWEKSFRLMVSRIRGQEIKFIGYASTVWGLWSNLKMMSSKFTLYVTLIVFVMMGNHLTAELTFVLATLTTILQTTCITCFPQAIIYAHETMVSVKRITDFLLLDEVRSERKDVLAAKDDLNPKEMGERKPIPGTEHGVKIQMSQVAANWVRGQLPPTLCRLSLRVRSQSLCAVVGPVGSGKSSLLHLLLGELPVGAGTLSFFAGNNSDAEISSSDIRISYTSQDPWLFSASVRHNILFGLPYDEARYREVTRVCALHKDFEELPQGDLSFVGERGASLSGGQRARVNLARAVYRDADLYLLDDPLSAVDPRVGRHLFEECICGFLKDKTRILVTHQLQYLQQVDTVVVLDRGTIEHQGTYEEIKKLNNRILELEETANFDVSEPIVKTTEARSEHKKTTAPANTNDGLSDVTHKNHDLKDVKEEEVVAGAMSFETYCTYFRAGGKVNLLAVALLFVASIVAAIATDSWVAYWTNQETRKTNITSNKLAHNDMNYGNGTLGDPEAAESEWFDENGIIRRTTAIYVYTVCIISSLIIAIICSSLFVRMTMNASRNLHDSMFGNLLQATMRFFNTNPSGRILNRFSKDVGSMDELLPKMMFETLRILSMIFTVLIVVVFTNYWMIVPIVAMIATFYLISVFYVRTAQNLKRLEGIAKSPVFSHVSSTLEGLATIRSRGSMLESVLKREFDRHQDVHTGAWHLSIATAAAFGFILDLVLACLVSCVCFSFVLTDDGNTSGAIVGLAISLSLKMMVSFQYGLKQCTEAISQMTSVERILQYTKLPKERSLTSDNPPPLTWPSRGALTFRNVTMRYAEEKPPALKNLNVKIESGCKVGVVGRTGAGKSSLISALFCLTGDGLEGEIVLDGIDTGSIGLHELRPRISIIPQEPILFSASLRHNLDPFNEYEDAQLWDALREVELGDSVPSLDFLVAGGGANFSVGQRQLICLARAILRNNKILVLDEATANVDAETDAQIQNTIRRRFADCTVLTIAHRLNTIMDSDRVLVMAEGRIVEFDHPLLLLKNREGYFSKMLDQSASAMKAKLAEIAESSLRQSPESTEESISDTDSVSYDHTVHRSHDK